MIELHWTITLPTGRVKTDPANLWDRASPASIAGQSALALSPEDTLLVLCLHLCREDFRLGLRPLVDITQVLTRHQSALDWDQFLQGGTRWKANKCLYLALNLADDLLDVPLPTGVLNDLRPTDINPRIEAEARDRALSAPYPPAVNEYLLRLWGSEPLKGKALLFLDSIFPPKEAIINRYALPPATKKIYLYYFKRLFDLSRQHGGQVWGWISQDQSVVDSIESENTLQDWWMS